MSEQTWPITHDCPDCGRRFGGTFGYDRHVDRRRGGRCRTDGALHRRGIFAGSDGVWRRVRVGGQAVLPGLRRTGGSRSVEDRTKDRSRSHEPPKAPTGLIGGGPQERLGLSVDKTGSHRRAS